MNYLTGFYLFMNSIYLRINCHPYISASKIIRSYVQTFIEQRTKDPFIFRLTKLDLIQRMLTNE